MEKVQQFRQPMITATGFFLGFLLDVANGWIPHAFTKNMFRDMALAIGIFSSIALLVTVLVRMLRLSYPDKPEIFYKKTLLYFVIGICIPFFAMIVAIVQKLIKIP